MTHESRRMPRREVPFTIAVVDCMTESSVGHLGNLSVGGMLLIASSPLVEDALYQLRFALPDGDGPALEMGAHVLWCDRAGAPGQSWVGLRFLALPPQAVQHLEAWVAAGPHI